MLQRAASNAYSWWWASHIRTKQSKWLEQSLQDMEEKVHSTLKLIEEDGDSFAKRAEMYYKKRPELINFVEESYRAYRALAERYDHISTELQNANSTIATVFPERVHYSIDDEEEFNSPNIPKNSSHPPTNNAPKVPTVPNRDLKGLITTTTKKLKDKKTIESRNKTAPKSGLNESEAIEEIEKLQKEILALQTVKEFVKSSYESGLKKHWEIENQITELQERVFSLQDEFKVGKVIEDDEARTLMAEAALRSCEETLTKLEERQEKSTIEARAESKRIDDTREKLKSFKKKLLPNHQDEEEKANEEEESKISEQRTELEILKKKFLEVGPKGSDLTVTELVEKIDELVGKVISLETSVSSQTALLDRLKTETNDLQAQIRTLEDGKVNLVDDKVSFTKKLREMEEKLHGLRDLNQNVEDQNKNLQTHFNEARSSLDHLSENLHSVKPDEELEQKEWLLEERQSPTKSKTPENFGKQEEREEKDKQVLSTSVDNQTEKEAEKECQKVSNSSTDTISEKQEAPKSKHKVNKHVSQKEDEIVQTEPELVASEKGDELSWQEMLLNGMEDREKILLTEYTTILRNYKEAKKNLNDIEKKNQDSLFELTVQLREQKAAVSRRDQEIRSLRQRLNLVQESPEEGKDFEIPPTQIEEAIEPILIDQQRSISPIEEKLRMEIDALLDENLDFWLRFSTSFHQIQKFRNGYQDLQAEIEKVKGKGKSNKEGSLTKTDIRSELRPIYRHLTEIQTELNLWIDQSAFLKDELQRRFSSLCDIQEEITLALKAGAEEEEMKFTSHEAAKFQGEVVNMKQENNMVRDELEAGLDHVTTLQLEIKKTIANLIDELGLSGARTGNPTQFRHLTSRTRIPLRSFIFGTKPKKKPSIFSSMHPRKYHEYKSGYQM